MTSKTVTDAEIAQFFDFDNPDFNRMILNNMDSDSMDFENMDFSATEFDDIDFENMNFDDIDFENIDIDNQLLLNLENSNSIDKTLLNFTTSSVSQTHDPMLTAMLSTQSSSRSTAMPPMPAPRQVGSYPPVVDGPNDPFFSVVPQHSRNGNSAYRQSSNAPTQATMRSGTQSSQTRRPVSVLVPQVPPGYVLRGNYTVSEDQSDCPPGHIMVEGHLTKSEDDYTKRVRELQRQRQALYRERKKLEKLKRERKWRYRR